MIGTARQGGGTPSWEQAMHALDALDAGGDEPCRRLLAGWSFTAEELLWGVAATTIPALRPGPPAALAGLTEVAASDVSARDTAWRDAGGLRAPEASARDRRIWAMRELALFGRNMERKRRSWETTWPCDPALDAEAARFWSSCISGRPFDAVGYMEHHLRPGAVAVFTAALRQRDLPAAVRERLRDDVEESFLYFLCQDSERIPPWLDLAARVVEGLGPARMVERIPPDRWRTTAGCLARRRSWGQTLARIWPDRSGSARTLLLDDHLRADPGWIWKLAELQAFVRLTSSWDGGGRIATQPSRGAEVLRHTRGTVRARLRALLAEERPTLGAAVMDADALHLRTVSAVRSLTWAWACREIRLGFALDAASALARRCPTTSVQEAPPALAAELRSWVLLVILRDRSAHLYRWVYHGTTRDRDATWGRLLAGLPPRESSDRPSLRRGARPGGTRGHPGARELLWRLLPGIVEELLPLLGRIARLPTGRGLPSAFRREVGTSWPMSIPFPERRFSALIASAARFLDARGTT